jgi:hypothetical protein
LLLLIFFFFTLDELLLLYIFAGLTHSLFLFFYWLIYSFLIRLDNFKILFWLF